ncbi:COG3618 Predicted metal-dependent hydrolase of the TIM-barrel fold [Rhabdaerophilaceae bacterium]
MRIDAHQHYWQISRADFGWLTPDLAPIYRDFQPDDLLPLLAQAGIDRTIAVQAAPTEAETYFLLELAHRTPSIAGVVGWVDFDAPDVLERIATMAGYPRLLGLRPMIHDIPDLDWMLSCPVAKALGAMAGHGLVFDALVRPPHLSRLHLLAARHPGLTIVIDHAAKPGIAAREIDTWSQDMEALADFPHVVVKLSGMVTEAGPDWNTESLSPYVSTLLRVFGAHRVIWGSDWPVLNLASDYAAWCAVTDQLLAGCSDEDRAAIMGGNACRVYGEKRGYF